MVIADADHGDAGIQSPALQPFGGNGAIERAERPQQIRFKRRRAVPEARLTHSRLPFRSATATDTARAPRACAPARRRADRPRARRPQATPRALWGRRAVDQAASPALP